MKRVAMRVGVAAWALFVGGVALSPVRGQEAAPPAKPHPDLTQPAPKANDPKFFQLHDKFLARAKQGDVGLLFLGDSITAGWAGQGKDVWAREYDQYKPANFGISGDHVNGVLWRVENGELENISPKVVVLMIGTNDSGNNTGEEIAAGIDNLVKVIRQKLPESKILLLAIFPRGLRPQIKEDGPAKIRVIQAANERLAKLDDGKNVTFLDIGEKFFVDGKIPTDVMPDQLHPNAKGYEIWADAMRPTLDKMMK